jgi:hypothetical protein
MTFCCVLLTVQKKFFPVFSETTHESLYVIIHSENDQSLVLVGAMFSIQKFQIAEYSPGLGVFHNMSKFALFKLENVLT